MTMPDEDIDRARAQEAAERASDERIQWPPEYVPGHEEPLIRHLRLHGPGALAEITYCVCCRRAPSEIREYREAAEAEGDPDAECYVIGNEGTFNDATGTFYCTTCYIHRGQPLGIAPARVEGGCPGGRR